MGIYIYGFVYTIIYVIMCNWFSSVLLGKRRELQEKNHIITVGLWIVMEYMVSVVFDSNMTLKMTVAVLISAICLWGLYECRIWKLLSTA